MKRLFYMIPFIVFVSFTTIDTVKNSTFVRITPKSALSIEGTSNITDFSCQYNIKNLNEPIRIHYKKSNELITFENSVLILENSGFDCGGRGINRDFHGLLKTTTYPKIVLNLRHIQINQNQKNTADALIEIEIAGQKKTYHMATTFHQDDAWHISGLLKLNIRDFNLEAPKKMLGMIVVSEEIEINFKLVIEECQEI